MKQYFTVKYPVPRLLARLTRRQESPTNKLYPSLEIWPFHNLRQSIQAEGLRDLFRRLDSIAFHPHLRIIADQVAQRLACTSLDGATYCCLLLLAHYQTPFRLSPLLFTRLSAVSILNTG